MRTALAVHGVESASNEEISVRLSGNCKNFGGAVQHRLKSQVHCASALQLGEPCPGDAIDGAEIASEEDFSCRGKSKAIDCPVYSRAGIERAIQCARPAALIVHDV